MPNCFWNSEKFRILWKINAVHGRLPERLVKVQQCWWPYSTHISQCFVTRMTQMKDSEPLCGIFWNPYRTDSKEFLTFHSKPNFGRQFCRPQKQPNVLWPTSYMNNLYGITNFNDSIYYSCLLNCFDSKRAKRWFVSRDTYIIYSFGWHVLVATPPTTIHGLRTVWPPLIVVPASSAASCSTCIKCIHQVFNTMCTIHRISTTKIWLV